MSRDAVELTVDIVACEGHGLCADLFPERIRLDDWGYPVIEARRADRRGARPCAARCDGVPDAGPPPQCGSTRLTPGIRRRQSGRLGIDPSAVVG